MRVISQDGTMDVPYETSSFNMICSELAEPKRTSIYCHHSSIGVAIKLAEYPTEAKAVKAMEILREAWINETVEFEDEIYHRNIIFQFPQDDEIEA